jgi:hydroxyacylglutathione hydrolase
MKIKTFTVNPFQMNSYVYYCQDSMEGVLIDPGYFEKYEEDKLMKFINKSGIRITNILMTHGHIDHVMGNAFAKGTFEVQSYLHEHDKFLYDNAGHQGNIFGIGVTPLPETGTFGHDRLHFEAGKNVLRVLHTPGHSPGGVCFIDDAERIIFPGDLIFRNSIGRTDLAGGDYNILIQSIKNKLFASCSDEYEIFPGHMEPTTIRQEKKTNPFLRD